MKHLIHACLDTLIPHERNSYRPYLLRLAGVVIALGIFSTAVLGVVLYRTALTQSDFLASVLPSVLVDLANTDRSDSTLASLTVNPLLVQAAQLKANDMATKGYFAHISPDGSPPWRWFKEAGYTFVYAGENLAINFDDSLAVNTAWMNSPTHRANILGNHYTEIGIATAQGMYNGVPTTFVVQEFGSPAVPLAQATLLAKASSTPERIVAVGTTEKESPRVGGAPVVSGASSYIAVKDEAAIPLPPKESASAVSVSPASSLYNRFLSSPSMLLELLYVLAGALLLITLIAVSIISHPHQKHHFVRIALLGTALVVLYLFAGYATFSNLIIK